MQETKAPGTPLNDDMRERRQHRTALADQRRQMKKVIMSPATVTPNAVPPKILTPRKATPLTPSAINPKMVGQAAAPVQKLSAEQRNKLFEEWIKITADNVRILFRNTNYHFRSDIIENQC